MLTSEKIVLEWVNASYWLGNGVAIYEYGLGHSFPHKLAFGLSWAQVLYLDLCCADSLVLPPNPSRHDSSRRGVRFQLGQTNPKMLNQHQEQSWLSSTEGRKTGDCNCYHRRKGENRRLLSSSEGRKLGDCCHYRK